jgi:hypothetical protein
VTQSLREALAELVALDDLKKSLAQAGHHAARFPTDENYATIDSLSADLGRRTPLAWAAARAALASPAEAAQRVPLTAEQIDAIFVQTSAEVAKLEAEHRYTFAGWLPIAVRLTETAHDITAEPLMEKSK